MAIIAEFMTTEVIILEPEMTLREAVVVLDEAGILGAPVTAGGRLVGVVSVTDILEFEAGTPGVPTEREEPTAFDDLVEPEPWQEEEALGEPPTGYFYSHWDDAGADVLDRFEHVEGPEWDVLDEHTVSEIMNRKILSLSPDRDLRDAARAMSDHAVHRIVVVEDDRLVGVVSSMDVVRAVAEGRL